MKSKLLSPGRYFKLHVMKPYNLTVEQLAKNFNVSESVITNFTSGRRSVTAKIAIALDVAFPDLNLTASDWMEMQYKHALVSANDRFSFDHIIPYCASDVEVEEEDEEDSIGFDYKNFDNS